MEEHHRKLGCRETRLRTQWVSSIPEAWGRVRWWEDSGTKQSQNTLSKGLGGTGSLRPVSPSSSKPLPSSTPPHSPQQLVSLAPEVYSLYHSLYILENESLKILFFLLMTGSNLRISHLLYQSSLLHPFLCHLIGGKIEPQRGAVSCSVSPSTGRSLSRSRSQQKHNS